VLTGEAGQLFSTAYLEKPLAAGADLADPLISPINFDRLADLPPTLVVTAKYDILHDSGVDYAERAKAAGGNVTHLNYDTLPHGFLGLTPMSTASDAAVDEFCRAALDLLS
jgi:acetyl esterase